MAGQKKGQDFSHMTRDQLYEIARERNIPGKSSMNKEELIQALQKGGGVSGHHKEGKKAPKGEGESPQPKGAKPEDFENLP